jgi:hypothetical protein
MDLNQDNSSSASSVVADDQATAPEAAAHTTNVNQDSPVDSNIIFDGDIGKKEVVSPTDPPISDEMKEEVAATNDSDQISSGIESGSSRFDAPSTTASVTNQTALSATESPFPKPELTEPIALKIVPPISPAEEPKGEILTTFVNTQNYADAESEKVNPSMSQATDRNETNFAAKPTSAGTMESAPVHPVTPDPTRVVEAESMLNPSSFTMPTHSEAANVEPAVDSIDQLDISESPTPALTSPNIVIDQVPDTDRLGHIAAPSSNTFPNVEPDKRKVTLRWLWVTLGSIFVVLFIFAGLVWATETGVINWGLDKYYSKIGVQKIWKGLPFDSRGALLISATKMALINQSHITAEMNVGVKVGDNSTTQTYLESKGAKFAKDSNGTANVLAAADVQMDKPDSTTIADEAPSTSPSFDNFSVKLKFDSQASLAKNSSRLTLESSVLSSTLSMYGIVAGTQNSIAIDEKMVDEKYYIRVPILSLIIGSEGNKWVMIDKADVDSMSSTESTSLSNISGQFDKYSDVIKSGEKTGVEEIDGVKSNKYHFVIDFEALVRLLNEDSVGSYDGLSNYTVEADAWIGQKDHFMRKMVMTSNGTVNGVTVNTVTTLNITDINKDFDVAKPTDDQIEKEGFGAIMNKVMGSINSEGVSSGDATVVQ